MATQKDGRKNFLDIFKLVVKLPYLCGQKLGTTCCWMYQVSCGKTHLHQEILEQYLERGSPGDFESLVLVVMVLRVQVPSLPEPVYLHPHLTA